MVTRVADFFDLESDSSSTASSVMAPAPTDIGPALAGQRAEPGRPPPAGRRGAARPAAQAEEASAPNGRPGSPTNVASISPLSNCSWCSVGYRSITHEASGASRSTTRGSSSLGTKAAGTPASSGGSKRSSKTSSLLIRSMRNTRTPSAFWQCPCTYQLPISENTRYGWMTRSDSWPLPKLKYRMSTWRRSAAAASRGSTHSSAASPRLTAKSSPTLTPNPAASLASPRLSGPSGSAPDKSASPEPISPRAWLVVSRSGREK